MSEYGQSKDSLPRFEVSGRSHEPVQQLFYERET